MSLKRLGAVLLAALAISALFASAASAAPETRVSSWKINGVRLAEGSPQSVKCSKRGANNFILEGTVAGAVTELTATGVECVEATISNTTVSGMHMAVDAGRLRFTGITVMKPEGCQTPATVETEPLVTRLEMDSANHSITYDRFEPAAGPTAKFASIELLECAPEGIYPVRGFVNGQATNTTTTASTNQPLVFNATTAGFSGLTLGGNAAMITGEANNELVSGASFSAAEE